MKRFSLGSLSGFVDRHGRQTQRLRDMPNDELTQILIEYRVKAFQRERDSARYDSRGLSTLRSSLSSDMDSPTFLASAIAYDRVLFDDPIAKLTKTKSAFSYGDFAIDRERLAASILTMKVLRPLIEAGVLIPLCLSAKHESDEVPVTYSEDRFRSCLPDSVLKFAHEHAIVRPGEMVGGPIVIYEKEVDSPVDCIAVSFSNDNRQLGRIWQLAGCRVDPNGKFEFRVDMDRRKRRPPTGKDFDAWREQSINQTALALLREVGVELAIAEEFGAHYATESNFEANLLAHGQSGALDRAVANPANFLAANASALKVDNPLTVLRFRRENQKRIEDFQGSLLAMAAALHDSDDFTNTAKREFDAKIRPQIASMDQAWAECSGKVVGNGSVAIAAAATMCLKGLDLPLTAVLPIAALGALGPAIPSVTEFLAKRKGIAYLWQKLA